MNNTDLNWAEGIKKLYFKIRNSDWWYLNKEWVKAASIFVAVLVFVFFIAFYVGSTEEEEAIQDREQLLADIRLIVQEELAKHNK